MVGFSVRLRRTTLDPPYISASVFRGIFQLFQACPHINPENIVQIRFSASQAYRYFSIGVEMLMDGAFWLHRYHDEVTLFPFMLNAIYYSVTPSLKYIMEPPARGLLLTAFSQGWDFLFP